MSPEITPLFKVTINKKNISSLTFEDADILADAFKQSQAEVLVDDWYHHFKLVKS